MNMVETETETTEMSDEPRVRYRERRREQPVRRQRVGGRDLGFILAIGLALAGIAAAAYFAFRLNQSEIDRSELANKLIDLEKAPTPETDKENDAPSADDAKKDADKYLVNMNDGGDSETPQPPAPVIDSPDIPRTNPEKVDLVEDPAEVAKSDESDGGAPLKTAVEAQEPISIEPSPAEITPTETARAKPIPTQPTLADPATEPVEIADAPKPPAIINDPAVVDAPQPPVPLETEPQKVPLVDAAVVADLAAAKLEVARLEQQLVDERTQRNLEAKDYQTTIEDLHTQIVEMKQQVAERDELEKSLLKAIADANKLQNELGELNRKIVAARGGQVVAKKAVTDAPDSQPAAASEVQTFVYPYTYQYYYPGTYPGTSPTEWVPQYWIVPN